VTLSTNPSWLSRFWQALKLGRTGLPLRCLSACCLFSTLRVAVVAIVAKLAGKIC